MDSIMVGNGRLLEQATRSALYPLVSKAEVGKALKESDPKLETVWTALVDSGVINEDGKLLDTGKVRDLLQ